MNNRRFEPTAPIFGAAVGEWSRWNFMEIITIRKLESMSYRMALFMWS